MCPLVNEFKTRKTIETVVCVTDLVCFYKQILNGHVEAWLRTYDIYSPYPEEFNRQVVSIISKYNFSPTERSTN